MAQASRSKAKSKPRTRSSNGSRETAAPARDYSIAAVGRALDLLEALSRIGPAPLAALASQARCTRTAGFRLLRTLEARGFAIQEWALGVAGLISILFGIFLFFNPGAGLLALLWLVGIYAVVFGVLFIVRAIQWRSWDTSIAVKAS